MVGLVRVERRVGTLGVFGFTAGQEEKIKVGSLIVQLPLMKLYAFLVTCPNLFVLYLVS